MTTSILHMLGVTLLVAAITSINGQTDEDVKFLDYRPWSDTPYEGIVQVYKDDTWGGICSSQIDIDGATVICLELGFKMATRVENAGDVFPDHDNSAVTVTSLDCSSSDTTLDDCNVNWNSGSSKCSNSDVAAIACSPIKDYALRLMGGASWYEGRVEVYHEGSDNHWGTVCDDYWGKQDAKVVCRQLKYGDPDDAREVDGDYYKPGSASLPVLLDNVHCAGSEAYISRCPSNGWHAENCLFNTELAAVFCEPAGETGQLTTGAIVGIVFASIIVVIIVVVVMSVCYRQCHSKKKRRRAATPVATSSDINYISQGIGGVTFISPGQQQQVQYIIPGTAPPAYSPPMYATDGEVRTG